MEGQFDVEAAVLLQHPFKRFQVLSPLNLLQLSAGCLLEMQCCQRLLKVLLDSPVQNEFYALILSILSQNILYKMSYSYHEMFIVLTF